VGVAAVIVAANLPPCFADDSPADKALTESVAKKNAGVPEILPNSVDLRPFLEKWGLETRLQHARNTCSVFVIAECIEYALATKQKHSPRLSIEFLNWAAHEREHYPEDGSNFADLLTGYNAFGVCPEEFMPYREKYDPTQKPSPEAFAHAKEYGSLGLKLHWIKEWDDQKGVDQKQLLEIKRTLARHWPVCGGFLWPKNKIVACYMVSTRRWLRPLQRRPVSVPIPSNLFTVVPREDVIDGHSVFLVGYRDDKRQPGGGVFLFRNTAGDFRDCVMTYEYALTYMNDAVWIDYEGAGEGGIPAAEMNGMIGD
jgi:hypothetical protein